jgi:hypothetical protein
VVALALLWPVAQCRGQGTMLIGFEGPASPGAPSPQPPGTYSIISGYIESGVWFRNQHGPENLALVGRGLSDSADDGTAYLYTSLGGSLVFSLTDGSPFNLISFDLAEGYTNYAKPVTIQMVGYSHGGGTVMNTFTTDGIIDGPGGLPDFQAFSPDSSFAALDRVEIQSGGFSLDNVRLGVPEPGTGRLLLCCAAALLASRVWRSRTL